MSGALNSRKLRVRTLSEKVQPCHLDSKRYMEPKIPSLRAQIIAKGVPSSLDRMKSGWVYQFYARYVKPFAWLHGYAASIWRTLYPIYVSNIKIHFSARAVKRWHPLVKLSDYVAESSIRTTKVFDAVRVDIMTPVVFPAKDQGYLESKDDHYTFPEVYVAEVKNAMVYGGTNLVFTKNAVVCHDLYDFERDYTSEELHGRHLIDPIKMRMRILHCDAMPKKIAVAASFVDACASNYAHWITEVLPRIASFCTIEQFNSAPIIIDDGLHPNIMASLAVIVGSEREIILLPVGRAINVDKLYVTSVAGYVPFEIRNGKLANHSHGIFCPSALKLVRNRCLSYFNDLQTQDCKHNVYLRRTSRLRQIVNRREIEKYLLKNGYVTFEAEKHSFMQQVSVLKDAMCVISSTGAAFVNAIFARPGAVVVVLMAIHEKMIYRYWLNMLAPLGIEVKYILGEAAENNNSIHSNFYINVKNMADIFHKNDTSDPQIYFSDNAEVAKLKRRISQ